MMAIHPEFRLLSCLLMLIIVAICKGNDLQQSEPKNKLEIDTDNDSHEMNPIGFCTREGEYLSDVRNCTIFYVCGELENPVPMTCPPGSLWNQAIHTCDTKYLCPLEPECTHSSQVFPNVKDCASFYFCTAFGVPATLIDCATGQYFNDETSACEDIANVDCKGRPGCRYVGQNFPDVYSCNEYFICSGTLNPIEVQCPNKTYWDTVSHDCVPIVEDSCDAIRMHQENVPKEELLIFTPVLNGDLEEQAANSNCSRPGRYLSDTQNCSIFYICGAAGGTPIQIECPTGSLFNPRINSCDPDYICPLSTECTYVAQVLPNIEDCASFYFCSAIASDPDLFPCPDGQFYNLDTHVCEDSVGVDCKGRPGCLYPGQNFANVYNCSTYYICNSTLTPIEVECPRNTSWDIVSRDCVLTVDATCAMPTTNKELEIGRLFKLKAELQLAGEYRKPNINSPKYTRVK